MRMPYFAHTAEDGLGQRLPQGHWQPLKDHLQAVAELAATFGKPMGMAEEAHLAGLLHDLGKYRDEFQAYLRGDRPGSAETQHAVYGAAWALQHEQLGTLLSVAGHHAGLHDLDDAKGNATKKDVSEALRGLVRRIVPELGPLPAPPGPPPHVRSELGAEFYTRLLLSCLVDADRLNSANWGLRTHLEAPLEVERLLESVKQERLRKQSANPDSPLGVLRNRVFDHCLEAGTLPGGFFSLTVPTGGGKTLAAMAFALSHAQAHGLRRIVVVIPYLSIIEQNAAEYRRILGDDVVLENHSAAQPSDDATEEERSRLDLVSENWDAPVVITTSVQFLESLFAASPSKCRKLHRIPRSVVIFDEVQTLPAHLLRPVFSVFRELQANYGVSFVFSSATQPAFQRSASMPDGFAPAELRELAPEPAELFRALRRVRYHLPALDETLTWPELADRLASAPQVLCVVNLTRHASGVWQELSRRLPPEERPIHLSAAMCPEHRLTLIHRIRADLALGRPCRVVSTQLIEAGVDVDFPLVYRAMGPLDSVVQVAGRCNREGRLAAGNVHLFRPEEHGLPRGLYQVAAEQAEIALAALGGSAAETLATDPTLFSRYFEALYGTVNLDYARKKETSIQDDRQYLRFREVARKAKVIEDSGQPVIVPYGHGAALIEDIRQRIPLPGQPRITRDDLRRLQRYMVNVRAPQYTRLDALRLIRPLLPNLELFVLSEGLYHDDLGMVVEQRPLEDFLL